jgi:large subunit ribosomal protein L10
VLSDWTRKNRTAGVAVLGGYVDGRVISAADVETLATLPSREQLLAMVAATVVAPMQNVAALVAEILAGVARAVDAVREQQEKAA